MNRWVNANQEAHWDKRRNYRAPGDAMAEAFARPKIDWMCEQLAIRAGDTVLDVGAGNGMFTWWWSKRVDEVVGLERSPNMIRRSPCGDLMREGDAYAIPFPDDSFDVAFAGNLLHHLDRPVDALREMARVSRGAVAVCEVNRNHPPMTAFGAVSSVCRGLLHYTRRSVADLADEAGIDVVALTLHGYVYENRSPRASLPASRALERLLPGGAYILMVGHVRGKPGGAPEQGTVRTSTSSTPSASTE